MSWRVDTQAGKLYVFSAYVVFDLPPPSGGVRGYWVNGHATNSGKSSATDSMLIYLDATGNQVDPRIVHKTRDALEKTRDFGRPTATDRPTPTRRVTWTPSPEPSRTPTPRPTRVFGYPTLDPAATPRPSRGTIRSHERGLIGCYETFPLGALLFALVLAACSRGRVAFRCDGDIRVHLE